MGDYGDATKCYPCCPSWPGITATGHHGLRHGQDLLLLHTFESWLANVGTHNGLVHPHHHEYPPCGGLGAAVSSLRGPPSSLGPQRRDNMLASKHLPLCHVLYRRWVIPPPPLSLLPARLLTFL